MMLVAMHQEHRKTPGDTTTPLAGLFFLALVLALASPPAAARAADDAARFVPAFTFQSGVIGLNAQAGVNSTERGFEDGDGRLVFPFVAPGLELSSPVVPGVPGHARLFLHAGPELVFDLDRAIAREGDPGTVTVFTIDPDGDGPAPPIFPGEDRVTGVGSETQVASETLAWTVGLGASFKVPVLGRDLRVKPSIEYRYDELEVRTAMSDASSISGNGFCPCRTVELAGRGSQGFHAIGPGLELEVDAQRAGPLVFAVFLSARGYYVLNDRFVEVRANGSFDTGEPASVVSTFRRSPWTFHGGVGFRVRWLPE